MNIKYAILALFLWGSHVAAEIHVIKQMEEIIKYIDDNTLVVLDIDNTILESLDPMACDQGFYYLLKRFQNDYHLPFAEANEKAVALWNQLQAHTITRAVEAQTPHLIANLNAPTMALTARDPAIKDITRRQLLQSNVDFSQKAPYADDMTLIVEGTQALYTGGILFQGEGSNKGKVLVEFLQRLAIMPTVIFVDDREKNIANVHEALSALPIKHHEFRYAATDERVKAFNEASQNTDFVCDVLDKEGSYEQEKGLR